MARIEDHIAEIKDADLRRIIAEEVRALKQKKQFGLVFEQHQPEVVPTLAASIRRGTTVAKKSGSLAETYKVVRTEGGQAELVRESDEQREISPLEALIVVRRMGEAIYPSLTLSDCVANGDAKQPSHILVEAENYHTLQLFQYIYAGKVDCIYLDPPYNTGARDWKYNNDYVDKNDQWRDSKWLSMMSKRLALAVRLLKSTGIMCITIDDYEAHRLRCLIEDYFKHLEILGVAVIRNNPSGRSTVRGFSVCHEYAVFVGRRGSASIQRLPRSLEQWNRFKARDKSGPFEWRSFRKDGGAVTYRKARPKQFYPLYISGRKIRIPALEWDRKKRQWSVLEQPSKKEDVVWPRDAKGDDRVWSFGHLTARKKLDILEVRRDDAGVPSVYRKNRPKPGVLPRTWWDKKLYSAREYGTRALKTIFGETHVFPFAKSEYAVRDCLLVSGAARPQSVIVDLFAGSGTTLSAVMQLNEADGGSRQCLLVTNNEVSDDDAKDLSHRGYQPGDAEWEAKGICRSVTWPRCKFSILGRRDDGVPLEGTYYTGRMVAAEKPRSVHHLGFADGRMMRLEQRRQLAALIPEVKKYQPTEAPWFLNDESEASILFDIRKAEDWIKALAEAEHVSTCYVVTADPQLFRTLRDDIIESVDPIETEVDEERPLAAGYRANLHHFRLEFLEPNDVARGGQFAAILPILWIKAGARGKLPSHPAAQCPWLIAEDCHFSVLMREDHFHAFKSRLEDLATMTHVFLVTNSISAFHDMSEELPQGLTKVQLYKDYLDNFKINVRRT